MFEESGKSVINIDLLLRKKVLKNSDYILTILEVCMNSNKYQLINHNSTRAFWDEVVQNEKLSIILKPFKPETLRKYWRIIRDLNDYSRMIELVKNNTEVIDKTSLKLLPVINAIVEFIRTKEVNFKWFMKTFGKSRESHLLNNPIRQGTTKEFWIQTSKIQTPKIPKKEEENTKKDIIKLDVKVQDNSEENSEALLDLIIKVFQKHFRDRTEEEIFQILYKTSCNLKSSYLVLRDKEKYENLLFDKTDDYVIQKLRNKKYYYDQVVNTKGKDFVIEREKFLNVYKEEEKENHQ